MQCAANTLIESIYLTLLREVIYDGVQVTRAIQLGHLRRGFQAQVYDP